MGGGGGRRGAQKWFTEDYTRIRAVRRNQLLQAFSFCPAISPLLNPFGRLFRTKEKKWPSSPCMKIISDFQVFQQALPSTVGCLKGQQKYIIQQAGKFLCHISAVRTFTFMWQFYICKPVCCKNSWMDKPLPTYTHMKLFKENVIWQISAVLKN